MPGFEVFPALDVAGGRLARLMPRGDLRTYRQDPVAAAQQMVDEGSRWIHVVDLDAALSGEPRNLEVLERVAALPARVQAGGGLSSSGVRAALDRGATRAILGARALLGDPGEAASLIKSHGDRVGMALDVRSGRVAPRGSGLVGPALDDALRTLTALDPAFLVYADVERDGAMAGPDLEVLAAVTGATSVPVVASGGVRSLADIEAIADVRGVVGVIVGRALHEGALRLEDALKLARPS